MDRKRMKQRCKEMRRRKHIFGKDSTDTFEGIGGN
jgi:hypothetical protein